MSEPNSLGGLSLTRRLRTTAAQPQSTVEDIALQNIAAEEIAVAAAWLHEPA